MFYVFQLPYRGRDAEKKHTHLFFHRTCMFRPLVSRPETTAPLLGTRAVRRTVTIHRRLQPSQEEAAVMVVLLMGSALLFLLRRHPRVIHQDRRLQIIRHRKAMKISTTLFSTMAPSKANHNRPQTSAKPSFIHTSTQM